MDGVKGIIISALQQTLRSLREHVSRFEIRLSVEQPHGLVVTLLRDGVRLVVITGLLKLEGNPPDGAV